MSNQEYEQSDQERQSDQDALTSQQAAELGRADQGDLREDLSVDIDDVAERGGRATIGEREGTSVGSQLPGGIGMGSLPQRDTDQTPGDQGADQTNDDFSRGVSQTERERVQGLGQNSGDYGATPGGAYSDTGQAPGSAGGDVGPLADPDESSNQTDTSRP